MQQSWVKKAALFLIVWGLLTMTINSQNAEAYGLQNATVAALVERHTFALVDQVIPGFNLVEGTETFRYGAHVYPMKQPGGTILGALVYAPLYGLGISFQNHFHYVSHLITMMTSGLMMAIVAVLIYRMSHSWLIALLTVTGTMIWPYAGVSHHDIYGVFLITLSLYFYSSNKWGWAGFASTLTWFFTMLPLTWPIVLGGIVAGAKNKTRFLRLVVGMLIGLIPTLVFNTWVYGAPWLVANLAGKVSDTVPLWSLTNLAQKLWFYLGDPQTAIWAFSPLVILGLLGARRKIILWLPPLLQLVHVASMETYGGFQYGPRYLLPTIPFIMLGIAEWKKESHSLIHNILLILTGGYSVGIALIGALQTTMYPVPGPYAPFTLGSKILEGELPIYRMFWVGLTLILGGYLLLYNKKLIQIKRVG